MRLRSVISLLLIVLSACGTDSPASPPDNGATTPTGLWTIGGNPGAILRLDPSQLGDTGRKLAASTITTPSAGFGSVSAMAFGNDGMLWIASPSDNLILGFDRNALSEGGNHAAAVLIGSHEGSLNLPTGIAFDRSGALWVTNLGNNTIIRYDATQLVRSGAPAPAVILSELEHPFGIAFDRTGGLWFSNRIGNTLNRLTFGELARSGTPTPTVVLRDTLLSIQTPGGLAIDADDNLWVANTQTSAVVGYSFEQILSSGAKVPHVTLQPDGAGSFLFPEGLAFDAEGSLWVIDIGGDLQKLTGDQLTRSSTPVPALHMHVHGSELFGGVAFFPKPGFGPLN